ncbi:MAG TPA: dihydrofolate reductase family protein [Anaerolineales bacterium]|nr:dihydrofolate reductase family protein [Anaerolineales bacterium]
MGKVIVGTTMSLDGFMNDRTGSLAYLYPDLTQLRETEMLQESMQSTGAVVMGRHAYDLADGDFTGYEYQVPIFVLTHHPPQQITKGQNDQLTVTFITDGVESAIEKARAAAGEKDVTVVGGASTAQQCINAGLFDEIQIGIVPILLGSGLRFFENAAFENIQLEKTDILESPSRIDLRYRVVR